MITTSRGVAITTIGNVVPPLAALITQPILARGLGVVGRGELAAATAPLLFATAILTLGLPESLTYHFARQARGIARLTGLSVGILALVGLAGAGLVAVLAEPLSAGHDALAQLIMIAALAIAPSLIVAALRGLAAGDQAWRLIAAERISNALLRLAAVVALQVNGALTPTTATIVVASTSFVGGAVYACTLRRVPHIDANGALDTQQPRLFHYAGQIWLGSVTGMMLSRLDQLLMTPLAGAGQLGYYAVAVSLSEVILVLNSSVREVLFATESRRSDSNRVVRASRMLTIVAFGGSVAIAVVCPWAIPFFFGSDFAPSTGPTLVLLLGVVAASPGSVAGAALSARGRPGLRSLAFTFAAAVNVVAILLFVPRLGAIGAAWATFIGNVVAGNLNIVWLKTFFGMPILDFYRFRASDMGDVWRLSRQAVIPTWTRSSQP